MHRMISRLVIVIVSLMLTVSVTQAQRERIRFDVDRCNPPRLVQGPLLNPFLPV